MAVLQVLTGDLEGRRFDIGRDSFSIGRDSENDLVFPKKYFSRRHAEIVQRNGHYVVRGLSRKNPIFHEDRETFEVNLRDGEVFEICDVRFRFMAHESAKVQAVSGSARKRRKTHNFDSDGARGGVAVGKPDSFEDDDFDSDFGANDDFGGDDFGAGGFGDDGFGGDGFGGDGFGGDGFDDQDSDDTEALAEEISKVRQRHGSKNGAKKSIKDSLTGGLAAGGGFTDMESIADASSANKPREKIVFGAEGASEFDDDENTSIVNLEDSAEQTGMIDLMDLDATNDDPFSNKDMQRAEQDKLFKMLSAVGLFAIVLAVIFLLKGSQTRPPKLLKHTPAWTIGKDQVTRFEIEFSSIDPPIAVIHDSGQAQVGRQGWLTVVNDDVAFVEWVLPATKGRGTFLVRGKKPGTTSFRLLHKRYKDQKTFEIKVTNNSPLEKARQQRMADLATYSPPELKVKIQQFLNQGEQLWKDRNSRGSEANYARVVELYSRAMEAVEILKEKVKDQIDSEFFALRDKTSKHLAEAKAEYETFLETSYERWKEYLKRGDKPNEKRQLEFVLRVIHDKKSYKYQHFKLFYDNYYFR